jgi:hypothetical protein
MLAVAVFYLWTASEGRPFPLGSPQDGHYNLMARALQKGRLSLDVPPRPELLELVDPYDPAKNAPYRLHDATLYHGRYYLYYGIAPALVAFLPLRLVGLDLPEALAAALFAILAFAAGALLLARLARACVPGVRPMPLAVAIAVLGLANGMPFLLRGPSVYEVAISAGAFFLMASALAFATAADGGRVRYGRLALGGLSAGLAVASRPNHLFAAPLLLGIGYVAVRGWPMNRARALGSSLLPLAGCLLAIAAYNAARFSNPFEFGTRYQLSGNHPHGLLWLDPRSILPGLYFDFLAPPSLRLSFPFVFLERRYPGTLPPGYFGPELIAGVLFLAPFLLLLLAARPLLRLVRAECGGRGPRVVVLLIAIGLANPLVTSFLIGAANQRYLADFVGFLVVPALVLWLVARGRWPRRAGARRLLGAAVGVSFAWAAMASVALSLTGYEDSLRRGNPGLYRALERRFEPIRVALGRLFLRDSHAVMRFRAVFPGRPAFASEPLVSSGTPEAQDVVLVRTLGPGIVAFSVAHDGHEVPLQAPLRVEPGRFYSFDVGLDRVRRAVEISVDGRPFGTIETDLGPVIRNQVWLGRGARGKNAPDLGRFSGGIVAEVMDWASGDGKAPLPRLLAEPVALGEGAVPPERAPTGAQWASTAREGVFVRDGDRWRWVARHFLDAVSVTGTLDASGPRAHTLVASGDKAEWDVVEAETAGAGELVVSYRRAPAGPVVHGAQVALGPGRHEWSCRLDRAHGLVTVAVDGRPALEAPADLLPLEKSGITIGALPAGASASR